MIGPGQATVDTYWRRCGLRTVGGVPNWDGDTLYVNVDMGCDVGFRPKLRLAGVNAPELKTGDPGAAARVFARDWLGTHAMHAPVHPTSGSASTAWPFLLRYDGWDNYGGRIDGVLVCGAGHCLNDDLLASGNARPMAAGG